MRVISGRARGLKLRAAEGLDTRPTADRVKESLFNIIARDVPGCCFLDLFSGTGANGIEALSRGAARAVFVDNSAAACEAIEHNLRAAKLAGDARVLRMDAKSALERLAYEKARFDLIFMDPPYRTALAGEALALIARGGLLSGDGFAVAEAERGACVQAAGFDIVKSRGYGSASLTFYKLSEGAANDGGISREL